MLILYVDGAKHVALQCDIRDEESVKYRYVSLLILRSCVSKIVKELGKPVGLVNVAGRNGYRY